MTVNTSVLLLGNSHSIFYEPRKQRRHHALSSGFISHLLICTEYENRKHFLGATLGAKRNLRPPVHLNLPGIGLLLDGPVITAHA